MTVERLTGVDGFVVFDLEGAATSVGVTRSAPKVLVDGATWLARSMTYQLASFELRAGGASAGVNAPPDGRAAALAAYVAEVEPWCASGRFLTSAGRGVAPAELAPLRAADPRGAAAAEEEAGWLALGVVVAAEAARRDAGGLDGCTVAIEQLDAVGARLVGELAARGARVAVVGVPGATVAVPAGVDPAELAAGLAEGGADLAAERGWEVGPAPAVLAAEVDVLVVGSKAGVVDHHVAGGVRAGVVAPCGPIPVTAKALAALGRAGVVVVPDFLATAGPTLATFPLEAPPAGGQAARDRITEGVVAAVGEVLGEPDGPTLAACRRAEAFLATWQDQLPFGRPLA